MQLLSRLFTKLNPIKPVKMTIIVRTDIKMGQGKVAAQVAHAAVSLYRASLGSKNPHLNTWLRLGQPKIVLRTNSMDALTEIYDTAIKNGLVACKIFDAGRTQIEKGTLTVAGIGPGHVDDIDKITNTLKML